MKPTDPDLCAADGCPNRWSVQREGDRGLCSAHAWSEPHCWPRITAEQLDAQTQRAFDRRHDGPAAPTLTQTQKLELIAKMRTVAAQRNRAKPKAWIAALQDREAAGELLGFAQRQCLEQALRVGAAQVLAEISPEEEELRCADARHQQEQRVRAYAESKGIAL